MGFKLLARSYFLSGATTELLLGYASQYWYQRARETSGQRVPRIVIAAVCSRGRRRSVARHQLHVQCIDAALRYGRLEMQFRVQYRHVEAAE